MLNLEKCETEAFSAAVPESTADIKHRTHRCRCFEAHSVHRHEITAHQREVTLSKFS